MVACLLVTVCMSVMMGCHVFALKYEWKHSKQNGYAAKTKMGYHYSLCFKDFMFIVVLFIGLHQFLHDKYSSFVTYHKELIAARVCVI